MNISSCFITLALAVLVVFSSESTAAVASSPPVHEVGFNFDKGLKIRLPLEMSIGYVERTERYIDGTTKRSTVLFAGNHQLTVPVTTEAMHVFWVLVLIALTSIFGWLLSPILREIRSASAQITEPGSGGNAAPPGR